MDALGRIQRAIRPGGVLLDLHPLPEHAWIEVVRDGDRIAAGQVDATRFIARVIAAEAALADQVAAGAFAVEQRQTFEFLTSVDGVEEWLAYMATEWTSADVPPTLAERLWALLPGGRGVIRSREVVQAARLRPGKEGGRVAGG